MPTRKRSAATSSDVADVVEPFVESVDWFEYDDNFVSASLDQKALKKKVKLWKALRELGSLRYTKTFCREVMEKVVAAKVEKAAEGFTGWEDAQQSEWSTKHFSTGIEFCGDSL